MQAVSRLGAGDRRIFRYGCATYWNGGASICANGRQVDMRAADRAVHDLLRREVLKPRVVERALDLALELRATGDQDRRRGAETVRQQLEAVERELANLAETVARGGAVPAILEALARRDEDRRRLTAELARTHDRTQPRRFDRAALRTQLRGFLDDWSGLLSGHVTEARPLLDVALAGDRIGFHPADAGGWELTVPIAFDQVMRAAVPSLGALQDLVASPGGSGEFCKIYVAVSGA